MQQNLEAIGFKVELMGLETRRPRSRRTTRSTSYDVTIAQGGDQGVSPFQPQLYYNCKQTEPAALQDLLAELRHRRRVRRSPQGARPRQAELEIFKSICKLINNEVDKVSLWTTNALSAKSKCLQGVTHPAGHP